MKKSERINQELFFLHDKSEFNLTDLMTTFNISKSTALRDIETLEEMGVPLYSTSGRYGGYQIIQKSILPPIHFNENEIQTIFFSLQLLKSMINSPFGHSYEQIKEKLLHTFSEEKRKLINQSIHCVTYEGVAQSTEVNNLDALLEIVIYQQPISFNYKRNKLQKRHFLPVRLVTRNGHWYCTGLDLEKREYRTFRCDYIEDVTLLDKKIEPLTQQEIELALTKQQQAYRSLAFKVEVSKSGSIFYKKNAYPNILLQEEGQHYFLTGTINKNELNFLAHYLLGYGEDIKTIYPKELLTAYDLILQKMKQNLGNMM